MQKLKEKNRLIFIINLARLLLIIGVIIFIQVFNYFDVEIQSLTSSETQEIYAIYASNIKALIILGIVSLIYAILLLVAPLPKIKSKLLGYIFCSIDSILIFFLIFYTGEISSPFIILLFFPLISLSVLYETIGSTFAIFIFTLFMIYLLVFKNYSDKQIADIFVKMGVLALFSLYLGNIGKEIKAKDKIIELETEIQNLKEQLSKIK
ncbi:MAG TPA: hypothetical protein PLD27_08200 [bacterium]|nr:hypothetical protein [bacterium]HPQ19186.1 hypothetical protein [bacterium]